jgi:hypothetical protein
MLTSIEHTLRQSKSELQSKLKMNGTARLDY